MGSMSMRGEDNKIFLSPESVENYRKELQKLISVERKQVIEEIKEARSQGDLSENAEYVASKDRQAQIEGRIRELEYILENYQLVDASGDVSDIKIGSTVEVLKIAKGESFKFQIVGFIDADPLNNKISSNSPLAKAVLKRKVGDIVQVNGPKKYDIKILNVE